MNVILICSFIPNSFTCVLFDFLFFQIEQKETDGDEAEQISTGTDNKLPKGSVIFFSGVSKTCTREDVKECLDKFNADIAYIDFKRGNTEGWVRLQGENAAKPLLEKTDEGKVREKA